MRTGTKPELKRSAIRASHKGWAHLKWREGRGVCCFPWFEKRGGLLGRDGVGRDDDFLTRSPRRDLSLNPPSVVWKGESLSGEGWRLCRRQPLCHGWLPRPLISRKALGPPENLEQSKSPHPPPGLARHRCLYCLLHRDLVQTHALHCTCMLPQSPPYTAIVASPT